jgi:hypothetical protein
MCPCDVVEPEIDTSDSTIYGAEDTPYNPD